MERDENSKTEWQLKIDQAYLDWKQNDLHKNIKFYFNECNRWEEIKLETFVIIWQHTPPNLYPIYLKLFVHDFLYFDIDFFIVKITFYSMQKNSWEFFSCTLLGVTRIADEMAALELFSKNSDACHIIIPLRRKQNKNIY